MFNIKKKFQSHAIATVLARDTLSNSNTFGSV